MSLMTESTPFSTPHLAHDREGPCPLSVEPHVLGVGLGEDDVVSVGHKLAEGKRVGVDVTRGKTLVRHVEEYQKLAIFGYL
jgi:hypothetical protein